MPGGKVIKPSSFIMSAIMFFILSAFLFLIPDPTLTFATTKWGPVGPRELAAVTLVLGIVSFGVWLLVKNRPKQN
jgi:hypothetical protein